MPVRFLLLTLFLGCVANTLLAKERTLKYEHYAVNNGLPSHTVYAAHEDLQGFLWICTDAGVSRFDGNTFTNFSVNDGLGENEIVDLRVDSKGRIWFFPFSGSLSYYDQGKFHNVKNDTVLQRLNTAMSLADLVEDQHHDLYFLCKLRPQTLIVLRHNNIIEELDFKAQLHQHYFYHHFINERGEVILFASNGVLYNLNKKELTRCNTDPNMPGVDNYYPEQQTANYWFDQEGLKRLHDRHPTLLIPAHQLPNLKGYVRICEDAAGNIWISHATLHTMIFFKSEKGYEKPLPVLDNVTAKVCFDRKQNVWLCSPTDGMFKIPSYMIRQEILSLNRQLHEDRILSTYLDHDHTFWLGYTDGFVDHVTPHGIESHDLGFGTRTYNRVLDITKNKQHVLYGLLDEGGMRLFPNGRKEHCVPLSQSLSLAGKSLVVDDNHVLFGYAEMLASFKEDSSAQFQRLARWIDPHKRHFSFFFDKEQQLYDSRSDGLHVLSEQGIRNLALRDARLQLRVNHVVQLSDGVLAIASYGEGVLLLDHDSIISVLNTNNGLAGTLCRRIYRYHDTLYISTNGGISVAQYRSRSLHWIKNITQADGLLSNDINSLFIADQKLYAGGSGGLSILPLSFQPVSIQPPSLSILSFRVNGKEVGITNKLTLPYSNYHLQASYVAPNLTPEQRVFYRYRLQPNSDDWLETKSTSIDFSNLPANQYHLELQARYLYSAWSKSVEMDFTINKPFFQTAWFISIAIIMISLLCYVLIRSITQRKWRKKIEELRLLQALEKVRDRIAADIHDDIGAELTNIVLLSQQGKSAQFNTQILNKLEASADNLMNKMNEVIWSLNHNNDSLKNLVYYVRDYIQQFEDNCHIMVDFRVQPDVLPDIHLNAQTRRNIYLVIKEALHNVYKYAGVDRARVYLHLEQPKLHLVIEDKGKGFEMNRYNLNGNGVKNMEIRIRELQGDISFNSAPEQGTRITINVLL